MTKKNQVECKSLGIPLREDVATEVDQLVKTLPKECSYRKASALPTNVELSSGERADISIVSAESLDRDNEVVLAKGMNLDLFKRNPVVTFAHNYNELPVGKAQWIRRVEGGIKAKTLYSQKPEDWSGDWFPDAVWQMTKEGILRGKSVGFLPTKIRAPSQDEISRNPTWKNAHAVIESAMLIEYAVAPIPVNQDALVEAVAKGMADEKLLARLGLSVPTSSRAKKTSLLQLFLKSLEEVRLDPDKIIEMLKTRYTA